MTTESVRSRRAVLAAAAGAVAATAASAVVASAAGAVASPIVDPARIRDGKTIHVGDVFKDVQSTTILKNVTNDKSVMRLYNGKSGIAVQAQAEHGQGV